MGYGLGGVCYQTAEMAHSAFQRTFPRYGPQETVSLVSSSFGEVSIVYTVNHSSVWEGTQQRTQSIQYSPCTVHLSDYKPSDYWLSFAVLVVFLFGVKLGLMR